MAFNFKQGASATRVYVLLVALLVLSLALITTYAREGSSGVLHTAQNALSLAASPLRSASGALSAAEDASAATASDVVADESSLSVLREQNAQLRQNLAELEEYRAEAQRLQELLDLKDDNKLDGTAARVLSRSSDAWNNVITIDKGTDAGIHEGLAVMASSGLIGQVISTTSLSSQVRLMQDPQFGVAAMVQSSRAEGIVKGALDGLLYLEDIDSDAQVALGDTVITSGLGGGFYRGILIGTVVKIDVHCPRFLWLPVCQTLQIRRMTPTRELLRVPQTLQIPRRMLLLHPAARHVTKRRCHRYAARNKNSGSGRLRGGYSSDSLSTKYCFCEHCS